MNADADLDLRSLSGAIRRYWPWIAIVALAAGTAGYMRSSTTKSSFESTAFVEIVDPLGSSQSGRLPNLDEIAARRQSVAVLFQSPTIFKAVRDNLGADGSKLRAISVEDQFDGTAASLLGVKATADSSVIADRAANAAVTISADVRRQRSTAELQPTLDRLSTDVENLDTQIRELEGRIKALDKSAATASILGFVAPGTEPTLAQIESQLASKQQSDEAALDRKQLATLQDQKSLLGDQIRDISLDAANQSVAFRLYQDAVHGVLSQSHRTQTAVLIGLGALFLALAAAFVATYTDGRLHHRSSAEADRLGVALLGGQSVSRSRVRRHDLTAVSTERAAIALAQMTSTEGRSMALGVMSADGDRDLALDLAITFARSGKRVVLIDANLRHPGGKKLRFRPGLAEVLSSQVSLGNAMLVGDTIGVGSLKVLPSGSACADPVAAMNPEAVLGLMSAVTRDADCVVVALASVLSAPENLTLAARLDTIILAGRVEVSSRSDMTEMKAALVAIGSDVAGLVVLGHQPRRGRRRFEEYVDTLELDQAPSDDQLPLPSSEAQVQPREIADSVDYAASASAPNRASVGNQRIANKRTTPKGRAGRPKSASAKGGFEPQSDMPDADFIST